MAQRQTVILNIPEKNSTIAGKHPAKSIEVRVYDGLDQLESIQQEWDKFVESVGCEIFLTYGWCRIWWKYYGAKRQPRVFIFRHEGTLVGIIPMFFEKIWLGPVYIRAGKIIGTDFTISTISLPIQKEFLQEVVQEFLETLVTDYTWDVLHIGPIAGIFHDFDKLLDLCRKHMGHGHQVKNENRSVQTYFMLAGSSEEQFAGLSKKQRRIIKQKYKALREAIGDENASITSQFASDQDAPQIFDRFVEMHQRHWQGLGRPGHFGDWPSSRQFHREVMQEQLKQNRLRLLEIKAGSYILGYKYAYKCGDSYLEFLDARLEEKKLARASLGRIIFCEQQEKAMQEGAKYIDSLRGKYEHKLRMGGRLFTINNIYIYSNQLHCRIRTRIFRILSWLLHICYYRIWFMRIATKLPLNRRPLWKIWIRSHMFA